MIIAPKVSVHMVPRRLSQPPFGQSAAYHSSPVRRIRGDDGGASTKASKARARHPSGMLSRTPRLRSLCGRFSATGFSSPWEILCAGETRLPTRSNSFPLKISSGMATPRTQRAMAVDFESVRGGQIRRRDVSDHAGAAASAAPADIIVAARCPVSASQRRLVNPHSTTTAASASLVRAKAGRQV